MADVNVTTQAQEPQTEPTEQTTQPTVEELMAQLASERAEKEKYKNASDKASSEAANYKKQLRSKQMAERSRLLQDEKDIFTCQGDHRGLGLRK